MWEKFETSFLFWHSWLWKLSVGYCVGISISEEHTATIFRSETNFTATNGQLYSWYPPIILHSCTVGTHQSYRTVVQLVPINHTAQHHNCNWNIKRKYFEGRDYFDRSLLQLVWNFRSVIQQICFHLTQGRIQWSCSVSVVMALHFLQMQCGLFTRWPHFDVTRYLDICISICGYFQLSLSLLEFQWRKINSEI